MKKLVIVLLEAVLLLSLFGCKKNTVTEEQTPVQENDPVEEIEETTDLSFLSSLEEKLAAGTISADDYVSCTLLSAFNGNEIPEAYRNENFEVTDIRPYIQNTMNCFDDLSEEVQLSVVEALTLCNIEFADVEEKNNDVVDMISDALFKDVNALADKAVIDQALLSKSGKFVIWYSDTDPNSAGHDKAQIVADTLDEAVEAYDSFFEVSYRFVSEYTYDETITYAKQGKILQRSGIDPSCLETCMNVYLSDFSSGSMKAYCLCGFDELGMIEKLVVPSAEAVWGSDSLYGIRTFPFIAIDSDSAFDTEMKMVIYHELFHYYQKRIIGDEPYCCDIIGGEGTANWASALKTPNTDNKVGYGEWADLWGMHCSEWLSHAKENAGYGLYPMLYNYQLNVEDGKQKIMDALFETDFLKCLEDNSTVDERKAMMKDLAQHTFANDNYIPAMNAKKLRISTKNLSEQTPETNKIADPLSVIYYQVNENAGNSTKLSFNTASDEMIAVVIAKLKDGSSCVIAKTGSPDEVVSLTAMDDLDHYFVAVCNCSFTASNSYSISVGEYTVEQSADVLRFEKTVLVDNEDITVTALGGIAEGRWININCEYQSKSSETLYLRYDDSILNGYTLETIFDDADYYGFAVEPKSNGKLLLRVDGSSVMRSSESYDALEVTIKDEYCIENGFDLTPCFKIAHAHGEVSENDYTIKGNTIQIDGGASDIPDSIIELYTQMSVEELAKRKLNKILYYQPMNASDGNFAVNGVAVAEYQDGTHFIMFETENLSDKDMGWLDNFIGISAVNGIAIDHIISTDCVMKPHTKRLCYIDTYPLSNEKRMAMYGLSSIGSYDIYVCMDKNDLLEDYTVSFGEESSCNVGQLLYEDDYGRYYYVGAGPTIVGDCALDDVLLIIKKEVKDDWFDFSNIKEVYADGELKDKIIIGEDCIRNGAFYEIELSNVDPTEDHELKIVTANGYSVVVDEIVIPYKGQPENK